MPNKFLQADAEAKGLAFLRISLAPLKIAVGLYLTISLGVDFEAVCQWHDRPVSCLVRGFEVVDECCDRVLLLTTRV